MLTRECRCSCRSDSSLPLVTVLFRGDQQDATWSFYYDNNLWQEVAFATFADKERTRSHICGDQGCHSCRKMLGPGGEEGPHSAHASDFMKCECSIPQYRVSQPSLPPVSGDCPIPMVCGGDVSTGPLGMGMGPEMKCGFAKVRDTDTICEMKCKKCSLC